MRTALGPVPAVSVAAGPAATPSVDGLLAALRARGLRCPPIVATDPAAVAALAAADPAARSALAAASAASIPPPPITALIALPGAGAAVVLAPGATHVHAGSGVVREVVVGAVRAALLAAAEPEAEAGPPKQRAVPMRRPHVPRD